MIYYEVQNIYQEHYEKEALIQLLNNNNLTYFGILHDKDIKPTGEIKKPHFHLVVGIDKDSKIAKSILAKIFEDEALLFRNVRNIQSIVRYLTHKDNLEKYQYEDKEVFTNNESLYEEIITQQIKTSKTDSMLDEFYNYIMEWNKPVNELEIEIFKWFRDKKKLDYYIRNKRNIDSMVELLKPYIYSDELERK